MMANPERGEVGLVVQRDGGSTEYVLKMTMNAAAAMQKRLGKPFVEIVADLEKMDLIVLRDLAFMLLQKHHKNEIKTVEQAGDLIDDAGGIEAFVTAFNVLMEANKAPGDATANPPNAQTTTLAPSTSELDAPA